MFGFRALATASDAEDSAHPIAWYVVRRRVPAEPVAPKTRDMEWGTDLLGRSVEGQAEPINFVGTHRAYGHCTTEIVWFGRCPADGMVSVLVDADAPSQGDKS